MHTIIASSARDHVLMILFRRYGSKAELFEGNLFWVGQDDHFPNFIFEEELIKY